MIYTRTHLLMVAGVSLWSFGKCEPIRKRDDGEVLTESTWKLEKAWRHFACVFFSSHHFCVFQFRWHRNVCFFSFSFFLPIQIPSASWETHAAVVLWRNEPLLDFKNDFKGGGREKCTCEGMRESELCLAQAIHWSRFLPLLQTPGITSKPW